MTVGRVLCPRTVRALATHVATSLHRAQHGSSTSAQVLTPHNRCDHKLSLAAPVRAALSESLDALQPVIAAVLGTGACLWELAALSSTPGAPRQQIHPDADWQEQMPALVVFLALRDVTPTMGPTIVLPGTNTERAHDKFNGGHAAGTRRSLLCSSPHRAPCLRRGDALLLDARCLHCGGANSSRRRRTLFYFTFVRRGCSRLALRRPSLLDSLRSHRLPLEERERWLATDHAYAEQPTVHESELGGGGKMSLARMSKIELLGMGGGDVEEEPGDCLAS